MDFRFNEEQEELRAMARAFLDEQNDSEAIRKAMASEFGWVLRYPQETAPIDALSK